MQYAVRVTMEWTSGGYGASFCGLDDLLAQKIYLLIQGGSGGSLVGVTFRRVRLDLWSQRRMG